MIMPVLYILQALLVAAALMMAFAAYPRLTGLSFGARSVLGLTLTPPVLGLSTLAIAFAWPGAPRIAFLLVPGLLAGAMLILVRAKWASVLAGYNASHRQWRHNPQGRWMIQAGCLGLIVFAASAVGSSFGEPTGHDILVYLAEARVFAEARTIAAIPGFDAAVGQVVKTHPHLFLWQAYLAQGLMATNGPLGFGHDFFARVAVQATFAFVPLSALVVARAATPSRTIWLTPPILLTFGFIDYIPRNFSVDGFRIITLLAFVALALPAVGRKEPWGLGRALLVGVVCGLAAAAHTLDIVFVGLIGMAFAFFAAIGLVTGRNLATAAAVCALFLAPVIAPYFHNWVVYHNVLGVGMYYLSYQGTPLWQAFDRQRQWTHVVNPVSAVLSFAWQYRLLPILTAMASAFGAIWIARRHNARRRPAGLAGIFLVVLLVPLLPIGAHGGLQGPMLSNERYGLVVCALAAPLIASFAFFPVSLLTELGRQRRWIIPVAGSVGGLVFAMAGLWLLFWSFGSAVLARSYLEENGLFVAAAVRNLPPGVNWATDRYTPTYFSVRPPLFLYARGAHPLLKARNEDQVRDFLVANHIGLVALHNHDADWWPATALYRELTGLPKGNVTRRKNWEIFVIRNLPGAH